MGGLPNAMSKCGWLDIERNVEWLAVRHRWLLFRT
jgi:hypothetical protein